MDMAKSKITRFVKSLRVATSLVFAFSLASCQELESEKPNQPKQIISTANSTVTGTGGEVGLSHAVKVRLANKNNSGLFKLVPTIVAVDGTGAVVAGITPGGCSVTDGFGYSNCTINSNVAGTYTLKVTSPAVFTGGTITFNQITRSMQFSTQPSASTVSGVAFAAQPVVRFLDRVGTLNASATDSATLALTTPGTATLSGTTTVAAVAGVATFAGLSVNIAGSYSFTATSGSLTSVGSDTFTITAGAASKLGFTRQPSSSTSANIAFSTQPILAVQDAQGNTVSSTCTITVSMVSPNGTDTFAGTFARAAANGVSDFTGAGLRVLTTLGGTTYTLTAAASGTASCLALTGATSSAFEITLAGVPAQLAIVTAPSTAALNQVWPTQPVIQVLDTFGNLVSGDNTTVVTIAKTSGVGAVGGSQSVTVVNGTATFTNLKIASTTAGDAGLYAYSYSGVYPGASISSTTTTGQTINANGLTAPFSFRFSVQPVNVSRGATMSAVRVQRVDANGHLNFSDNVTTVSLTINGGGTLNGGTVRTLFNGETSFSSISITGVGATGNHSLNAVLGAGVATTTAVSDLFAVSDFGTATRLAFTTQPVGGSNPWATQPVVAIQDSFGNTVSSDNSTVVTIGVVVSSGTTTLTGTFIGTAVNGVVTFTDLGTVQPGLTGIILEASANTTLTATQSNSFNGATFGTASKLGFTRQPVGGSNPWAIQPRVAIQDSSGNTVTTDNTTVVTLGVQSSSGSTTLTGTVSGTAVNGVVTFAGLGTAELGRTGIILEATSNAGHTSALSSSFTGAP